MRMKFLQQKMCIRRNIWAEITGGGFLVRASGEVLITTLNNVRLKLVLWKTANAKYNYTRGVSRDRSLR